MKTNLFVSACILTLILCYQNALSQPNAISVIKKSDNTAKLIYGHEPDKNVDLNSVDMANGLIFTYDGDPKPNELIAGVARHDDTTPEQISIAPKAGTTAFELTAAQHLSNAKSLIVRFKFSDGELWPKDGITFHQEEKKADNTTIGGGGPTTTLKPDQILFPFSSFSAGTLEKTRRNRVLIVDGNPNPQEKINATLKKYSGDEGSKALKSCKIIPNNASISVIARHMSLRDITAVSVNLNSTSYSYTKGIEDLMPSDKTVDTEDTLKSDADSQSGLAEDYFKSIGEQLKKIEHISFNDLALIRQYQQQLKISYEKHAVEYASMVETISQIVAWNPDYVEITTLPMVADEADEIEIEVGLTRINETKETLHKVGTFKTSGGVDFHVNSSVFITNLVDRDVYTEDVPVENNGNSEIQRFARLDDSAGPLNLGVGANGELSFRTGSIFRPTVNIGVFVPFEQDLSPIFASGIGTSIGGKKVRLALSGGLAFGQVSVIKSEFKDRDLAGISNLTNESLAHKVWKSGWQFALGLSFNLK